MILPYYLGCFSFLERHCLAELNERNALLHRICFRNSAKESSKLVFMHINIYAFGIFCNVIALYFGFISRNTGERNKIWGFLKTEKYRTDGNRKGYVIHNTKGIANSILKYTCSRTQETRQRMQLLNKDRKINRYSNMRVIQNNDTSHSAL